MLILRKEGGDKMAALICWLICGYVSYEIAKSKGRDPITWAVIGFLFSILGVLLVAILPSKK